MGIVTGRRPSQSAFHGLLDVALILQGMEPVALGRDRSRLATGDSSLHYSSPEA